MTTVMVIWFNTYLDCFIHVVDILLLTFWFLLKFSGFIYFSIKYEYIYILMSYNNSTFKRRWTRDLSCVKLRAIELYIYSCLTNFTNISFRFLGFYQLCDDFSFLFKPYNCNQLKLWMTLQCHYFTIEWLWLSHTITVLLW